MRTGDVLRKRGLCGSGMSSESSSSDVSFFFDLSTLGLGTINLGAWFSGAFFRTGRNFGGCGSGGEQLLGAGAGAAGDAGGEQLLACFAGFGAGPTGP